MPVNTCFMFLWSASIHLYINIYVINSTYYFFLPKWELWHIYGLIMCFLHTLILLYKHLSISYKMFPARVWIRRAVNTVYRGPNFLWFWLCWPKTSCELVKDEVLNINSFNLHEPSKASSLVIPILQMSSQRLEDTLNNPKSHFGDVRDILWTGGTSARSTPRGSGAAGAAAPASGELGMRATP